MTSDDPVLRLIEALAHLDAEDYLRAEAANDPGSEPGAENPALPATGTSA